MEHSPNPISRKRGSESSKIGSQSTKISDPARGTNNSRDPARGTNNSRDPARGTNNSRDPARGTGVSNQTHIVGEITDERLEEIKMQHYNRKSKGLGNSPSQS